VLQQIESARADLAEKLPDSVLIARFLCGLTTPAISRARLQSDRRFGCLESLPFQQVLDAVSGLE